MSRAGVRTGVALPRRALLKAALGGAIGGGLRPAPAVACSPSSDGPSRWSLAAEAGVWWLRTPCGERFYSLGVNTLDGGYPARRKDGKLYYCWKAFAPSLEDWAAEARRRLLAWGFNSVGAWSLAPRLLPMPQVIDLALGHNAGFHWVDPFAPDMAARMNALARELTAPYRGSPYRIGYFSDNEVGWWAGALFAVYSMYPSENATKRRWLAMLRRLYADEWPRFAADFLPPAGVTSWDGLLASEAMTRLRPGGNGTAAVRQWTAIVAGRYYQLCAEAIRAADPDALYFGDRLPIYYDPAAVRAMAPYVDAIAVNYNLDSSDGWIARYFFSGLEALSGGKPVLISEWFFAARNNRTGNRDNGHLMTVATQEERARGAAAATRNFAAIRQIVGAHWFQYSDEPKGGRPDGEDYDFGLVDINDRPYRRLTESLAAANRSAPALHAAATPAAPVALPFVVPHARIVLDDHSLSDWPKPASLLPPLRPSPGEVAFGEVYLSWSEKGLAVATIGQDYFDSDLLAYRSPFPLSEAYRLELGIDVGGGPRRLTLFFIPPRRKLTLYPMMQTMVCAGSARDAIGAECPPLAGAEAAYFGADQPRITAELRLAWIALGIRPPRPGMRLTADLAVTSWYGARWMSLSGRPPESAMADAAGWQPMTLGDGILVRGRSPLTPERKRL